MPLYNLERSANAVPHVRYMAGTASWMISTDNGMQTVTIPPCLYDFGRIKTGWGCFMENEAPSWVWDPSLDLPSPRPNDGREWKKGFHVMLLLPQEYAPFQLREFATTSVGAVEGIKALYAQYEQAASQNPGKVPLVRYMNATPAQIGRKGGRTNVPNFRIDGWYDRPALFDQPLESHEQQPPARQQYAPPPPQQQTQPGGFGAPPPSYPSQVSTPVQPPQTFNAPQAAPPQQDPGTSGDLGTPVF